MGLKETNLLIERLNARLLKMSGKEFQRFFENVMKACYDDDFRSVKPHGRHGDYGCDGFLKDGTFFAVYAPEKTEVKTNEINNKMEKDLKKLIKNSEDGKWKTKLNKFVFVINYKDDYILPSPIISKVDQLTNLYCIDVNAWSQNEILDKIRRLELKQIQEIMNTVYIDAENLDLVFDVGIMAQIIEFMTKTENNNIDSSQTEPILFNEKIRLNNLSHYNYIYLNQAFFSLPTLENLFKQGFPFSDEVINKTMIKLYDEAKKRFSNNANDQLNYIFSKSYEYDKTKHKAAEIKLIDDNKWIILCKYFENCSIFEKE